MLACIGLSFILYHLLFEISAVTSDSMSPALRGTSYEKGDRLLMEKVTPRFRAPERWEIYFYYDAEGNPVAKRVVGLPGERIAITNNRIYINGLELERPDQLKSVKYYGYGNLANGREVECGNNYFMLGDDSADSLDSRFTGLVPKERFRARAWCIVWPRDHIGFVK
jgi:signal peptidase I